MAVVIVALVRFGILIPPVDDKAVTKEFLLSEVVGSDVEEVGALLGAVQSSSIRYISLGEGSENETVYILNHPNQVVSEFNSRGEMLVLSFKGEEIYIREKSEEPAQ